MKFITNSFVSKKGPKSKMAANHATNYSYIRFALSTILKQVVLL